VTFEISEDNYLAHYGILRRSGRYPWGSGGDWGSGPNATTPQRSKTFLDHVQDLKNKGLSEQKIAAGFGMTTTQLRDTKSIARNAYKQDQIAQVNRLAFDKGWSNMEIARRMNLNESTVRSLKAQAQRENNDILTTISNMLRKHVDEKGYIDVGSGVENHFGVSSTKWGSALAMLKSEGYVIEKVQQDQQTMGSGQKTTTKVLAKPGETYLSIKKNLDKIQSIVGYSEDGGRTLLGIHPPISIDSKRVGVRYAKEGGKDADGVIYVRPGVEDVSLGGKSYAQVRIAVDGSHYLKGMAMYKDDLPKGVDLVFNTNKNDTGNKLDAMKELKKTSDGKVDMDNPFGAVIDRQISEKNPDGSVKRLTSVMNIVNDEGKWEEWSRSLSSQMLSKQTPQLAKRQLDMTYDLKKGQLDEIMGLTNPAVRKLLLDKFADEADSSAIHMKAHALPGQGTHVILPVNSLKDTEVYAPNFKPGDRVVLIRFPHGGIFEIPELTVNNSHPEAKKLLGNARDAIGINAKVAERLSGADFDGDTVLVIPNNRGSVRTKSPLKDLDGFDPQRDYKLPAGEKFKGNKQTLMGDVSNLITDMTIGGASDSEIARAVKHSMVVIDAEKHDLDYKRSAIDHGIRNLKEKYQNGPRGGASTIVSRKKKEVTVPEQKLRKASKGGPVDPETGKLVYEPTGRKTTETKFYKRTGETVVKEVDRTSKVKWLDTVDTAHELVSDARHPIELLYADHSDRLRGLANTARKESYHTKAIPYSPSAKKVYDAEAKSLKAKLDLAMRNRPLERDAQRIAAATVKMKTDSSPNMDPADLKKIKSQAVVAARLRTGAKPQSIHIEDREWEAIQAGAISNHMLEEILKKADINRVRELATPRVNVLMDSANKARAKRMLDAGHTQGEIADALGISVTTLKNSLK
jgi:DNA-binding CsgD family transcriptional regulator